MYIYYIIYILFVDLFRLFTMRSIYKVRHLLSSTILLSYRIKTNCYPYVISKLVFIIL